MILFFFIILFLLLALISPLIIGIVLLLTQKQSSFGLVVLGVYFCLLGSFFVYGLTHPRTTPGHIIRWCRGEYGLQQRANDLAVDAKKTVNPDEFQKWAQSILQEASLTNSSGDIPRNQVPVYIQNLYTNGGPFESAEFTTDKSVPPEQRSVWIVWGGGFGHWGIRIGPPSFRIDLNNDENYYTEWKPGIYFWCETH